MTSSNSNDTPNPEDDLWFLPGPPEDAAPSDPPWPFVRPKPEFNLSEWRMAEQELGQQLVQAAVGIARLDERLRHGLSHYGEHLALMEVADQLWAQGEWVAPEKLSLYRSLRLSSLQDARVMSQADWAIRRMLSNQTLEQGLQPFLGRHGTETDGLAEVGNRPIGPEFEQLESQWLEILAQAGSLHPLSATAVAFFAWRNLGLSDSGAILEPLAAISTMNLNNKPNGLPFLPVALGDKYIFNQTGEARKLLALWLGAIDKASQRGLLHIDRLEDWRSKARTLTASLTGRTPPVLIQTLLAMPLVSAEIVATKADISKVSAQRNLALFANLGLIKEVTGQERYRFWAVKI